jgi:two-component system cell cycle sensor histidine kinase/response regulator CckA
VGLEDTFQSLPEAYQSVFENTGTAMIVVDDDMKILLANSELERITGYSRQELEGLRLWTDFICAEDLERMKEYHLLRRADGEGIPSSYTFCFMDRGGRRRDVSISVNMLPGTRRSIASLIDISYLKQAERELKESEQRYRVLVEDMPALICRFRSDGTLTFVNKAYCNYFDRSAAELVGYNFFHFIPEEERETVRRHFQSLTPSHPLDTYEHKVVDRNGELRWQQWTDRALFSAEGELIEFQSLGQDITARRKAEEEKERIQGQLQQALRMEAVGRLTTGFAHDCNNILTVITGFGDMLLNRAGPGHEFRAALEAIMGAAGRGEALTKKLLAFSRRQVLQPELLDINELIGDAQEMLHQLLGADIELQVVPGKGLPAVKVDRVQIEQVILNLAINARDAMPSGGMLRIATGISGNGGEYQEQADENLTGLYVTIDISDTGTGMTGETLAHIFEPFYTTKETGKGTGLGLSTAYGIIKQSGGSIQAESSPGKGTRFRVQLPACPGSPAPAPTRNGEEEPAAGSGTVLVVEDDANVRALLENLLQRGGYAVMAAGNGSEALALLQGRPGSIDLLVADLVMPGMNGRELAEKLRSAQPGVKILFISGYPPDSVSLREPQSDNSSFLPKPFSAEVFLKSVRELLDKDTRRQNT